MNSGDRFNPDFNKQSDLPSAELPRESFEEIAAREAIEARMAENQEDE
jgi:hypothetical protein